MAAGHSSAGSRHRLDQDIRSRASGSGPGHPTAQLTVTITPRTDSGPSAPLGRPRRHEQAALDGNGPTCVSPTRLHSHTCRIECVVRTHCYMLSEILIYDLAA